VSSSTLNSFSCFPSSVNMSFRACASAAATTLSNSSSLFQHRITSFLRPQPQLASV
jgi:hypothetical protein